MKKPLIIVGAISVMLGISGMITEPEPQMLVYEEIPHEEVQTDIEEKEQKEDLGIDEAIEPGQDGSDPEELSPAAGEVIKFSYEDEQSLLAEGTAEAANQGEDGIWLAMSVPVNRAQAPEFPDNVTDCIYQYTETKDGRKIYQFSSVANGSIDRVEIPPEAYAALERIKSGDVCPEIIAFERAGSGSLKAYFEEAFQYRDHVFYTKKIQ